jgi:hypothetical protein
MRIEVRQGQMQDPAGVGKKRPALPSNTSSPPFPSLLSLCRLFCPCTPAPHFLARLRDGFEASAASSRTIFIEVKKRPSRPAYGWQQSTPNVPSAGTCGIGAIFQGGKLSQTATPIVNTPLTPPRAREKRSARRYSALGALRLAPFQRARC